MDEVLRSTPNTLLVFIDETGAEDYGDPRNPTFGRGGCAALGSEYKKLLVKPWSQLKRGYLGGANKPFHAVDFQHSGPTRRQIFAINRFLRQRFWRFAVMSDFRTSLPAGVDAHQAVAMVTLNFLRRLAASFDALDTVQLVFEASERGDSLVRRDFAVGALADARGRQVEVQGNFAPKASKMAGLEIADLVAHTAGRQRRHQLAGRQGVTKDFEAMYWHSPIPPAFMAIDTVQLDELPSHDEAKTKTADPRAGRPLGES